jgi:hypothetical protein
LRFDTQKPRGHLEIVRRLIELQHVHAREKLLGDARDRDVVDVDLLVADERQQKVERSAELRELDDEGRVRQRVEPARLDHGRVEVDRAAECGLD